jgi:hypothetical protein
MDVQQLSDLYEIQRLKARYFRFMDLKMWDQFKDVFTEDFELFVEDTNVPVATTPSIVGRDALIRYLSSYDPPRITIHQGHMPEIDFVDADHATGIWAMYDWVDDPGRRDAHHGYGHYHEQYVRCPDGRWRISSTHLTRIRVNTLPWEPVERARNIDPEVWSAVANGDGGPS